MTLWRSMFWLQWESQQAGEVGKLPRCLTEICCCIIITPEWTGWKPQESFILGHDSCGSKFTQGTPGELVSSPLGLGPQLEVWSLAPGIIQRLVYSPIWHLIPAVSWDLSLGCWMETHRHSLTMGPELPHNMGAVFEKWRSWESGRQKRQQVESYCLIKM